MSKRKSVTSGNSKNQKGAASGRKGRTKKQKVEQVVEDQIVEEIPAPPEEEMDIYDEDRSSESTTTDVSQPPLQRDNVDCRFIGEPVPIDKAKARWPHRYPNTKQADKDEDYVLAKCHYLKAEVDGNTVFQLNDDAHVFSGDDKRPFICKIIELFEAKDGSMHFRAQWYYRSNDTVIKDTFTLNEEKRIFFSEVQDDNPLDCLLEKVKIVRMRPNVDLVAKRADVPACDYYYDLAYLVPFSTFILPKDDEQPSFSTKSSSSNTVKEETINVETSQHKEMSLLDLYSGCGAMSTGLTMGAQLGGVNLKTRWAVDFNEYACASLKLNHPETEVRNETVDDFLLVMKEWKKMCVSYGLIESQETHEIIDAMGVDEDTNGDDDFSDDKEEADDEEVFEVEKIVGICFGDPKENGERGLYFKVHWKGYDDSHDTWEPASGLGNCRQRIGEFVKKGFEDKILPLPGDADVICGGPPCQGISGFNRFRNMDEPLKDEKNRQLLVYLAVVDYLKPKYVLMENVVDLVKFAKGYLGRYAVGALVNMNYQTRLGMMAAGAYGLAQFRMRVFLWAAQPTEKLPQYPLPTHEVLGRGVVPTEFELNTVAYDEGRATNLKAKLYLGDAISDLPEVTNDEHRDVIPYGGDPQTDFQRFIRKTKKAMVGDEENMITELYDHRPLKLNDDDFQRVCRVPHKKGANFRDFPEVLVRDNKVQWNPDVPREMLPSGKPLVPSYAMSFVGGTSSKPFGRLWWDETVPTVVTRAEPHNQAICHPTQNRVLTIRENARLQGFPDYYRLSGPIKQRYMQVGNAVAVPVARALGFGLARACEGLEGEGPLFELPAEYPSRTLP